MKSTETLPKHKRQNDTNQVEWNTPLSEGQPLNLSSRARRNGSFGLQEKKLTVDQRIHMSEVILQQPIWKKYS